MRLSALLGLLRMKGLVPRAAVEWIESRDVEWSELEAPARLAVRPRRSGRKKQLLLGCSAPDPPTHICVQIGREHLSAAH